MKQDEMPNLNETSKAENLLANEGFKETVIAMAEIYKRYLTENSRIASESEEFTPDVSKNIQDLDKLIELFKGELLPYDFSYDGYGGLIIRATKPKNITPNKELDLSAGRVDQVRIRLSRPALADYDIKTLSRSPEEVVMKNLRPLVQMTIIPEEVYSDDKDKKHFIAGTGVTVCLYEEGYIEIFSAVGVGKDDTEGRKKPLYTCREPLFEDIYLDLPS